MRVHVRVHVYAASPHLHYPSPPGARPAHVTRPSASRPFTLEQFARDVIALLDLLQIPQVCACCEAPSFNLLF